MGVVTVGVFLIECYWTWRHMTSIPLAQPLTGLLLAAASLASFFIHYTFVPGVECFQIPQRDLQRYAKFTGLMFAGSVVPRPLHVSPGMTVLGVTILLAVIAVLGGHLLHLLKGAGSDAHRIGTVLLSDCLLFSVNASIGRLCLGFNAAFASRYVTLLIPALLAIYFYLLSQSWQGKRNFVLALWVLLLLPAACANHGRISAGIPTASATGLPATCARKMSPTATRALTFGCTRIPNRSWISAMDLI